MKIKYFTFLFIACMTLGFTNKDEIAEKLKPKRFMSVEKVKSIIQSPPIQH